MKIIRKRSNVFSNKQNKKHFVVTANQHIIYCDTDDSYEEYHGEHDQYEDVWDSIKEIDQEFTSENTSINSTNRPALFGKVSFEPGTVNVDYGGGKFDNVADYLAQYDVINMVLDPFNRSKKHNREVINLIREHGGADTATCANVLNVIKEPENRYIALENLKKLVKPGGKIYIWIHEGNKSGVGEPTTRGYQLNRKSEEYMEEILQVFPNATRKGKLITAINDGAESGTVAASVMFDDDGRYEYVKSKSVEDSDGFLTDYTMYYDVLEDKYVFVFGDRDLYDPNEGYDEFDWECDTEQEANEWYYNYEGFIDDDIDVFESKQVVNCSTYGKYTYTMDIDFRGDINITESGVDIYENTFSFDPEPYRNDYYKDEDTGAKIISVDDILQYINDILNGDNILNADMGAHTISGVINIVAEIDGVNYSEDFRGRDEDGDPTYDREFFTDDSDSIIKSFDIEIVSVN